MPAGAFRTKDPNEPIELKITEFYNMSDFILNNLSTTTTQNELLVSGGTIDLQAFSNGEKIELNDLVNLQVQFKNRTEDDGMMPNYAYEGETVMKWSIYAPPRWIRY